MDAFIGKEQVSIGSAPDNDVVLQGPGVAPRHAVVQRRGRELSFVDLGASASFVAQRPIPPNQPTPLDFRAPFLLGQVPLPFSHPALVSMILARGSAQVPRGQVLIGREADQASLVVASAAVSGRHASVMLDRMVVMDHGSTSGTYMAGQKIPPNQPVPIDPGGVLTFGPIPIPVSLLMQIANGAISGSGVAAAPVPMQQGGAPPSPAQMQGPVPAQGSAGSPGGAANGGAAGGGNGGPPKKHRTIIGELSMVGMQSNVVTIGRTPDNQIVVPHPQVSSRHAVIHTGPTLFLEDKGSANGTRHPHRRREAQRRRGGSAGLVGGAAAVRNRGLGSLLGSARSRRQGANEDLARPRVVQGAAG
jgi:pSer/pThr/pTyr-binding forkhead associated (FHA) protein